MHKQPSVNGAHIDHRKKQQHAREKKSKRRDHSTTIEAMSINIVVCESASAI